MKDKIDLIFSDLKNEVITEKQAHQQVLDLFAVSGNEVALPSLEQCANACDAYAEAKEERKREYGLVFRAYQEGINWALNFVNKARQ